MAHWDVSYSWNAEDGQQAARELAALSFDTRRDAERDLHPDMKERLAFVCGLAPLALCNVSFCTRDAVLCACACTAMWLVAGGVSLGPAGGNLAAYLRFVGVTPQMQLRLARRRPFLSPAKGLFVLPDEEYDGWMRSSIDTEIGVARYAEPGAAVLPEAITSTARPAAAALRAVCAGALLPAGRRDRRCAALCSALCGVAVQLRLRQTNGRALSKREIDEIVDALQVVQGIRKVDTVTGLLEAFDAAWDKRTKAAPAERSEYEAEEERRGGDLKHQPLIAQRNLQIRLAACSALAIMPLYKYASVRLVAPLLARLSHPEELRDIKDMSDLTFVSLVLMIIWSMNMRPPKDGRINADPTALWFPGAPLQNAMKAQQLWSTEETLRLIQQLRQHARPDPPQPGSFEEYEACTRKPPPPPGVDELRGRARDLRLLAGAQAALAGARDLKQYATALLSALPPNFIRDDAAVAELTRLLLRPGEPALGRVLRPGEPALAHGRVTATLAWLEGAPYDDEKQAREAWEAAHDEVAAQSRNQGKGQVAALLAELAIIFPPHADLPPEAGLPPPLESDLRSLRHAGDVVHRAMRAARAFLS